MVGIVDNEAGLTARDSFRSHREDRHSPPQRCSRPSTKRLDSARTAESSAVLGADNGGAVFADAGAAFIRAATARPGGGIMPARLCWRIDAIVRSSRLFE